MDEANTTTVTGLSVDTGQRPVLDNTCRDAAQHQRLILLSFSGSKESRTMPTRQCCS